MARTVQWGSAAKAAPTAYYTTKFLAQVAQNVLFAAMFVAAGTSSDAAMGLSSLFLAMLLPALFFGVFGGAVVDRVGAARGYALGAGLRFGAMGAALFLAGGSSQIWIAAFLYSTVSQIFTPAEMALVRSVQANAPGRAHSFLVGLQYGGQAVGMVILAPILYFIGGVALTLSAAVVIAGVVFALTLVLAPQLKHTPAAITQTNQEAFTFGQTCRFFAHERLAAYAVVVIAFKVIVARGIVVVLPFYLQKDMGLGHEAIIYLMGPGILGVIVGLLWASRGLTLAHSAAVMRYSLAGMVVAVLALAVLDYGVMAAAQYSQLPPIVRLEASMNTTFAVAVPVAFLLGLTLSTALISARVALTETAPPNQQARVWAVQGTLTDSLLVLPLLLAGVGTEFAGARFTLGAIGVLAIIAMVALEVPRLVARGTAAGAPTEPAGALQP